MPLRFFSTDRPPARRDREPPLYTSPPRGRHGFGIIDMAKSMALGVPRLRSLMPILLTALATSMLTYTLFSLAYSRTFSLSFASIADCAMPTGLVVLREDVPGSDPRLDVLVRPKLIGAGSADNDKEGIFDVEGIEVRPATNLLEKLEEDPGARKEREALTAAIKSMERKPAVKGPPTTLFRDNLLPDRKYITTWHDAGWNNQVIMIGNMLYLAHLTGRTPILPQFVGIHHLGIELGSIPFSEVFDVPRLSRAIGMDMVDWTEVKALPKSIPTKDEEEKDPDGEGGDDEDDEDQDIDVDKLTEPAHEQLGCWSSWAGVPESDGASDREGYIPTLLGLDISYTPTPPAAALGHNSHLSFWGLAKLAYKQGRVEALMEMRGKTMASAKGWDGGHTSLPDEQVLCFDFLYYVCASEVFEIEKEWSPVWNTILTHLHWTPHVEQVRDQALASLLGISYAPSPTAPFVPPPYIAVHVRHGDFQTHCPPNLPTSDCFTPLSAFAKAVEDVREDLRRKGGSANEGLDVGVDVDKMPVLVASDEQAPEFWEEVRKMGWKRINHGPGTTDATKGGGGGRESGLDTAAKHGRWYEVLVDAAIMAGADGFVGTHDSTMSLFALRRTREWRGGVGRMVKNEKFV